MVQLIKKGGLRERANRSRSYQGSENTETTLKPNRYQTAVKTPDNLSSPTPTSPISPALNEDIPLNSLE
ncbi:hypothetical protein NI470_01610 [Acinetobacter lwoffii]|jgi:hypothetical protein|uniref:hypothetical protein n=1 Tax=Acinetobacter TaxID=469 RepID=UPI000DF84DD9|nr:MULTISPECIES: hypothetical protein [Acinetobacter]MCO8072213.1 hypothetical protein [Acinetobacter lwoffii]MCO8075308.1 hypothetical protein [Acinetobacter lwoffii]RDC51507.1 hypothetical protein DVA85_13205 [Acinetobacter sp. RIT592]HCB30076.1 hypothetical protein [Acinetobacter lwoffii]